MARITFIEHGGKTHFVAAAPGVSLMQTAIGNNITGIVAECGGACACATCHVYIDDAWRAATGAPDMIEQGMLEFATHVQPNSRLSCQVTVTESLDGLLVRLPVSQG